MNQNAGIIVGKNTQPAKPAWLSVLALFTSTGTLLCCALPATLAAIGGGVAVGALISTFPWLIPLSAHKQWLFLVAGMLITFNGTLVLRPQGTVACTITGGKGCEVAGRFQKVMFWGAAMTYVVGVFMAYGIVPLLRFLES